MSMFPGPGAQVYYNDAGEPLGWDYPSDEPDYDPDDWRPSAQEMQNEDDYERGYDDGMNGEDVQDGENSMYMAGYNDGLANKENADVEE
jgi:hypothetical protein